MTPYYADDQVTLYLGDCREATEWLQADVLVTDPPYGIGWTATSYNGNRTEGGIEGDQDTAARDFALAAFGDGKPCLVFGCPPAESPKGTRQVLIWAKPPDAGFRHCLAGWRRDWEAIYLVGSAWQMEPAARSAVLRSNARSLAIYTKRGHPHTKPVDLMEQLIDACPPGVIADPFAGSGSTLVAARNLGRRAIGVELEERYCEVAARRLAQDVLPLGAS
ncbi:MAG TPA: site-specific DNA-methyltransferase [Jiangellaceae bacterium]